MLLLPECQQPLHYRDIFHVAKLNVKCKSIDILLFSYINHLLSCKIVPQIKSLAIDDERKLLYILTSTSIEVVDIGNPQNDYKSIFKHTNIVQNATQMCRQSSRSYSPEDFSLESVHIISTVESKKIHLMAITTAGFRLYFSTYKDASRQNLVMNTDNVKITPSTLELVHVRLPPAEVQQTIPGQLTEPLRYTYYDCGICLSINPVNEDIDSIYCTSVAPNNVTAPQQPVFSNMTSYVCTWIKMEDYLLVNTNIGLLESDPKCLHRNSVKGEYPF